MTIPASVAPRATLPAAPARPAPIPLVDLAIQHRQVAAEVDAGWARVLAAGDFILGADVVAFEEEFARFSGAEHCVGVANGTDALELALRARGVGRGDEVVLPANTFVATAEAVSRTGARPVLVDCDPEHLLVDPDRVSVAVTGRTRAVVAVHLYGQMAPVDGLRHVLQAGIDIIEDAAQSQGATRHGQGSGSVGAVAATSFYPGKNLGAYGDAGAVLTSDEATAATLRELRAHGGTRKYVHDRVGMNSRLDTLQAVVLRAKLRRLSGWNAQRRQAARRYAGLLGGRDDVVLPTVRAGNEHVWHLFVVRVPHRDAVLAHLAAAGIGAGIHYPQPVHLLGAYRELGYGPGDFPVAEAAAGELLSLPLFPGITPAQQERVATELVAALEGRR